MTTHVQIFNTYEELWAVIKAVDSKPTVQDFPVKPEDIETMEELLTLITYLKENPHINAPKYKKLLACYDVIVKFNNMIGLTETKENMASQILALCDRADESLGMINSVIYGPPGCGKTTLAHVLAEIYMNLGVVKDSKLVKGDRATLIGAYIGETAIKTKKVLQSALGGVLFIDEAYQLGHAADGNRCPYAYECINTINQFITEHPGKIVIILAGYERDIKQNFFAQNDGLARRFPFKFNIIGYSDSELFKIFHHQARTAGYNVKEDAVDPGLFKDKHLFEFYGGDTENLFECCRIAHDKRMFSYSENDHIINNEDVQRGLKLFMKHKDKKDDTGPWQNMYL